MWETAERAGIITGNLMWYVDGMRPVFVGLMDI